MAADEYETPDHLMADLRGLVDGGLLVEVRTPGEPSRYALSTLGEKLATRISPGHHEDPVWPEPCPVCGATEGFDGGGRCRQCHVASPPEM
jgi:hypothetical protein